MLNAIGIYIQQTKNGETQLILSRFAQTDDTGIFKKPTQLNNTNKVLLEYAVILQPNTSNEFKYNNEYIYLVKSISQPVVFFTIASRKPLDPLELCHLFKNIANVYHESEKVTLEKIIADPLQFIGKDVDQSVDTQSTITKLKYFKQTYRENDPLVKTQKELAAVKGLMYKNIDLVLERGEKIETTLAHTEVLLEDSIVWNNKARKMNSCC